MSALDRLLQQDAFTSTDDQGKDLKWIDADTFDDADGNRHRLQRVQAPETLHGGVGGSAEAGGEAATAQTIALAKKLGYTKVSNSGEKDKHGRFLSDLVHPETGESFTKNLSNEGVLPIFHGFDKGNQDLKDREYTQALKTSSKRLGTYVPNEFEEAAAFIDEATRAESDNFYDFKRAQEYSGEIGDIQEQLKHAKKTGNDEVVRRLEDKLASVNKAAEADTVLRDRNQVTGMSKNPMSVAWDQGWDGAAEGAYGFLELLGESSGVEGLKEYGSAGIARQQDKQEEYARILTDWKDVEGFSSGVQYIANNALMSLPYMAITAGAAVAGTGLTVATGGGALAIAAGTALGLGAPSVTYAGQVWNEMEGDKNAAVAVTAGLAQAALDRLGIGAIRGIIPGKNFAAKAVEKIMKSTGVSKKAASQTLANATKVELTDFMKGQAAVAVRQKAAKKVGMDLLKGFATGAAGESVTEMGQEAIGYIAAVNGSDKVFHWEELNERLIAAAIAGGALGGAFATPGGLKKGLANYDAEVRALEATDTNESDAAIFAQQEKEERGYVPTNLQNVAEIKQNILTAGEAQSTTEERAVANDIAHGKKTFADKARLAITNPAKLFQGSVDNAISGKLKSNSRSARVLSELLGGGLQKTFGGAAFENAKFLRTTELKNMVPMPQKMYATFSKGELVTPAKKEQISKMVYDNLNAAVDKNGNFDPNLLPDTDTKPALVALAKQMNAMADKMYADQAKYNPELGYQKNYLFGFKTFSKKAVSSNGKDFEKVLQKKYKYTAAQATQLREVLANDPNVNSIEEAFTVVSGAVTSSSHKARVANIGTDPDFAQFMEQDIFANMAHAAKQASRYTTHQEYFGENNQVVSKLLEQMQTEGVPEAEVNKVAAGVRDILDAESGNYKRPTSDAGRTFQKYQKNAMTYMTLSGLPLAAISSFPELMLVNKGLTHSQIFGEKGSLKQMGSQLAATLSRGTKEIAGFSTRRDFQGDFTADQERIRDLGFYDWDVGAGQVSGVTEINASQQATYETFFKWTGLQGWTNYTRAVRASMAGDYILAKVELLANFETQKTTRTAEVQEAQEALRNLGITVDDFIKVRTQQIAGIPLDPELEASYGKQMKEATFNWVNDAIALPGAANRPLIYQDPRFALFTQFQGFISTFTANHIPKLWGEYVKRGTPAMKYSAFATATTMIMMGFVSQAMKDELKYGLGDEEDKTLGNPHLDTANYIRRGVAASGLLGTGERVLSFFDPIYESNSDGAADWVFDSAVGESPAIGYVQRVAGAVGSLFKGDVGGAAKSAVKAAPVIGPLSFLANTAEDKFSDYNFNGE